MATNAQLTSCSQSQLRNRRHPRNAHQSWRVPCNLQVAAVGFKQSKASIVRFDLNEQMQVWAEMTGGGDSQPVRIIIYADVRRCAPPPSPIHDEQPGDAQESWDRIGGRTAPMRAIMRPRFSCVMVAPTTRLFALRQVCLLNQTTLQLTPYREDKRTQVLKQPSGTEDRLRPEALSLLCFRERSHRQIDKLRLKVVGVSAGTTRNQRLDLDGDDEGGGIGSGSGSGSGALEAHDGPSRAPSPGTSMIRESDVALVPARTDGRTGCPSRVAWLRDANPPTAAHLLTFSLFLLPDQSRSAPYFKGATGGRVPRAGRCHASSHGSSCAQAAAWFTEGETPNTPLSALRICEPHERLLRAQLLGSYSTSISTRKLDGRLELAPTAPWRKGSIPPEPKGAWKAIQRFAQPPSGCGLLHLSLTQPSV